MVQFRLMHLPSSVTTRQRPIGIIILALVSAPLFFLLAHNSGYGYDQLEYLVIGRSLNEGYRFFDFIPSKSVGVYLLVQGLLRCGVGLTHVSLSLLIAAVGVLMILATWWVARARFGERAALIAAFFVGVSAAYMELNYLQPTGFVYLAGLLAFHLATSPSARLPLGRFFLAGAAISVGFHFKSVAAFYGLALAAWLLIPAVRCRLAGATWPSLLALALGAVAGLAIPLAPFLLSGRGAASWEWTVSFPLLHYPANTLYLRKIYTKLLAFGLLWLAALGLSLRPALRRGLYSDPAALLCLFMGLASLVPALKTQSSHYFFPGGAFLGIFSAVVISRLSPRRTEVERRGRLKGIILQLLGALLLAASALLYRPAIFTRLVSLQPFDDEPALVRLIDEHCPPGSHALFFRDSTRLYWLGHRYPNVPFVNMDVQTTYYLQRHGEVLSKAIDDPSLTLVEWNHDSPGIQDNYFWKDPRLVAELERFDRKLREQFSPLPGQGLYRFWVRREERGR